MPSTRVPGEAVKTVNTFHLTSMAPEYDYNPSTAPKTSEQANPILALSPKTTSVTQLRYADRKAQFARPGWVIKERRVRMERLWAATAQTKQHLACHDCYIRGQIAPECILPLKEQKQVVVHYDSPSSAEKTSVPTASYLWARQRFGTPDQDGQLESTGVSLQSHGKPQASKGKREERHANSHNGK